MAREPCIRVGLSGWRYESWRGVFYPPRLPQRAELAYAARCFSTVELNGSFYSLQRPEHYRMWARDTPPGFVFAVKGSRFITHMKKLAGVEDALANFFASGVLELGRKLGPILWQFPAQLGFDEPRFAAFLALLPRSTTAAAALARRHDARVEGRAALEPHGHRRLRYAFEIRHPSFLAPAFAKLLRRHGAAFVVADSAGRFPRAEEMTADFAYVRLHGSRVLYTSPYSDAELDDWAERIRTWGRGRDVYVYFDNDAKVHAPFDAQRLGARLGQGLIDFPRVGAAP